MSIMQSRYVVDSESVLLPGVRRALGRRIDRRQISVVLTTAMYHGNPRLPDRLNAVSTAAAATAAAVAVSFVQSVQIAWTVIR